MKYTPAMRLFQTIRCDGIPFQIELEGKEPKPAHLKNLIARARELGVKAVFVQPQFSSKSAELIAREIGGQVVIADPLAPNWPENLRRVALQILEALR